MNAVIAVSPAPLHASRRKGCTAQRLTTIMALQLNKIAWSEPKLLSHALPASGAPTKSLPLKKQTQWSEGSTTDLALTPCPAAELANWAWLHCATHSLPRWDHRQQWPKVSTVKQYDSASALCIGLSASCKSGTMMRTGAWWARSTASGRQDNSCAPSLMLLPGDGAGKPPPGLKRHLHPCRGVRHMQEHIAKGVKGMQQGQTRFQWLNPEMTCDKPTRKTIFKEHISGMAPSKPRVMCLRVRQCLPNGHKGRGEWTRT